MELTANERETLQSFCDAIVPSVAHEPDPHGVWGRKASDTGVHVVLEHVMSTMPPADRDGLRQLLNLLHDQGFNGLTQASKEQLLFNVGAFLGAQVQAGITGLTRLVLIMTYGAPDPATGQNPNWAAWGYPGPLSAPPDTPKTISVTEPTSDSLELEADVVVVGSGAGGGVIAAELAQRGMKVVVLEMGPYKNEADFSQLELVAYQDLYWRGGPQTSVDGNFISLSGSCLGGGTVVNWSNSLHVPSWVLQEWADAGLTDVVDDFRRHEDAVWERIEINADCTDVSPFFRKIAQAADGFGWSRHLTTRNVNRERYDADSSGYTGFGDQSGSKNSTMRTYLQDAFDAGAAIVVDCFVEKVLVEDGRAAGVTGTWRDRASGRTAAVTVRAPRVVAAGSAFETPALLLRSGIGGPFVGQNLRLHTVVVVAGVYDENVKYWWGAPHSVVVDEFEPEAGAKGWGFRVEGVAFHPGLFNAGLFVDAMSHKELLAEFGRVGLTIGRIRDHDSGRVTIDENGQAQIWYTVDDPVDIATLHKAIEVQVKLHAAAGAQEIRIAGNVPPWKRGDDLDEWIARAQRVKLGFGGLTLFAAHMMGSAPMGTDPQTSVANPDGELHDVPGVWIGDGSAFPTPTGVNPMVPIMSLAHRTAERIAAKAELVTTTASAGGQTND
jgi:choline dehydrogenase-like flavoprotein